MLNNCYFIEVLLFTALVITLQTTTNHQVMSVTRPVHVNDQNIVERNVQYGRMNFSCFNGGSLINGKCHCQERFEGEACEFEPCFNGGRKSKAGKCHCPYGLTGERCEITTHCIEGKGKLVNGRCECESRWTGVFCQTRMCHNGVSVGRGGQIGSFCLCDIGFTGPFCESAIQCIHGSITAENICSCEPNWDGEDCNQCAYGHQYIDDDCQLIVTDNSLTAVRNATPTTLWSLILIITTAFFFVALTATITTIYVKKYRSKPSKINLDAGTDV